MPREANEPVAHGGAPRNVAAAALIFVVLVAQVTLVNRVTVAFAPDLVLLTVVALAVVRGPIEGAVIGFCAGLVADLVPPADHPLGQHALVLCVTGFLAGRGAARVPMVTVAIAAVAAPALAAGVGALLGDPGVSLEVLRMAWPRVAFCNLLAAPVVVWIVSILHRDRQARAEFVPSWRRRPI
jgi:rod shape-determining protein MreD